MLPTSAAALLDGISKTRAKRHQSRAAGILPISTLLLGGTEMFLLESKHVSH